MEGWNEVGRWLGRKQGYGQEFLSQEERHVDTVKQEYPTRQTDYAACVHKLMYLRDMQPVPDQLHAG